MVDSLIMSLLVVDVGVQVVIIDRIMKAYQRNKQNEEFEEEENLTRYESYDSKESQKGWEFKILRTSGDRFRSRKLLQKACEEEAKCGWILLEKLDNRRLRFRRPLSARLRDQKAKIDPYRSYYGLPAEIESLAAFAILMLILSVPAYLGFTMMQNVFSGLSSRVPTSAPLPPKIQPAGLQKTNPSNNKPSGTPAQPVPKPNP